MLLSYDPPLLFVHIDKAAGSSIQIALRPLVNTTPRSRWRRRLTWLGPLARIGALYRVIEFPEHSTARVVRKCLPSGVYATLFKFAFVRNPWDRLVSRYAYLLRNANHPRHGLVSAMRGFDDYVEWEIRRGKMFQYPYVTDEKGDWIVDFVGRFETLSDDFALVCERLNLRTELPRANASSHRDYRSYYPDALRERVREHFRRDIELFGYTFEGVAGAVKR